MSSQKTLKKPPAIVEFWADSTCLLPANLPAAQLLSKPGAATLAQEAEMNKPLSSSPIHGHRPHRVQHTLLASIRAFAAKPGHLYRGAVAGAAHAHAAPVSAPGV